MTSRTARVLGDTGPQDPEQEQRAKTLFALGCGVVFGAMMAVGVVSLISSFNRVYINPGIGLALLCLGIGMFFVARRAIKDT